MTRYAFWRQPDGKAYRRLDDKHALGELLSQIGQTASVSANQISWHGFSPFPYETALRLSIVIVDPETGDELNQFDSWNLVRNSLIAVIKASGGAKRVVSKTLLAQADQNAANFFRRSTEEYVLATSLTLQTLPAKKMSGLNYQMFGLNNRRRFAYPPILENTYPTLLEDALRRKNIPLGIRVAGRTSHEAVERALGELNLARGLWTLFARAGSWTLSVGNMHPERIGVIHAGPFHTIHRPDGSYVDDVIWYDADMSVAPKLYQPSAGWKKIEKGRQWAIRRLKRLPYARDLVDVIARFAVALDYSNHDVVFIHLWSILEKITNTVGGRYDETIARAVWSYKDRKLAREMLGATRIHRNRLVHAAREANNRDQIAYLIKSFIEPHIFRLLRNDFRIESLEEYAKCLALPTNLVVLRKNHQNLRAALRLLAQSTETGK